MFQLSSFLFSSVAKSCCAKEMYLAVRIPLPVSVTTEILRVFILVGHFQCFQRFKCDFVYVMLMYIVNSKVSEPVSNSTKDGTCLRTSLWEYIAHSVKQSGEGVTDSVQKMLRPKQTPRQLSRLYRLYLVSKKCLKKLTMTGPRLKYHISADCFRPLLLNHDVLQPRRYIIYSQHIFWTQRTRYVFAWLTGKGLRLGSKAVR